MYWPIQEKIIFSIVFSLLFCFQLSSIFILKEYTSVSLIAEVILLHLIAVLVMIYYAKWVWNLKSFSASLKKVILYELALFLSFFVFWAFIKFKL